MNGSVLAATDKIGRWFDRQWLVQSPHGRRAIAVRSGLLQDPGSSHEPLDGELALLLFNGLTYHLHTHTDTHTHTHMRTRTTHCPPVWQC